MFSHRFMQLLHLDVFGSGNEKYIQASGEIILVSKGFFCLFFLFPPVHQFLVISQHGSPCFNSHFSEGV